MKKPILITLLCASLMLVTPLTSIAQENKISNNIREQPDDVEGLVVQIKGVINEILEKYGHIPTVRGLCNMILNLSDLIGKIIYCIALLILFIPVAILVIFFGLILWWEYIGYYFAAIAFAIIWTYDRNCPPGTPLFNRFSSLLIISTLKDIDDITNLAKGCPCLEE